MKAISIKQPFAALISQGKKTIEVRSWATKHRGPLLICSSQKPAQGMKATKKTSEKGTFLIEMVKNLPSFNGFYHLGAACCVVDLYDCTPFETHHQSRAMCEADETYFSWHFRNPRPVKPVKIAGKLNFYEVEDNLIIEL